MSLPEVKLWGFLRGREPGKPRFRRQHPVGPYVLDFYCVSARLAIEVDGEHHSFFAENVARDARRDAFLKTQGVDVRRIAAKEVLEDAANVARWAIGLAAELSGSRLR